MSVLKLGKHFLTQPQIVRGNGADYVHFTFAGPTPFPEMKYPGSFSVEVRRGYAEEWLKECFGIEDAEVIEVGKPR
jgi:hypothetical protein